MAFLGRSRKEDLRMLATELGLAPSDNLKIIELVGGKIRSMAPRLRRAKGADYITSGSPMSEGRFDLSTFRSERTNEANLITNSDRYDEEFVEDVLSVIVEERTATEKQKAAELEEKQKAMVLAQQREREFELEK
ncbi:hypothetical protein TNCV_2199071 [Trichonephila clavipes]|nr:hypothetical protein TNCV_2199071 [Trichonephila clavipes]